MLRLSHEDMIRYTKEALAPLDCVCEFKDHSNQFGFAIYFDHRDRIVIEDVTRKMANPATLSARLHSLRSRLKDEGEVLNEWQGIPLAVG